MNKLLVVLLLLLNVSTILGAEDKASGGCAGHVNLIRKEKKVKSEVKPDYELEKLLDEKLPKCPKKEDLTILEGVTILWPEEGFGALGTDGSITTVACVYRTCTNPEIKEVKNFYAYKSTGIVMGPATMALLAIVLMVV